MRDGPLDDAEVPAQLARIVQDRALTMLDAGDDARRLPADQADVEHVEHQHVREGVGEPLGILAEEGEVGPEAVDEDPGELPAAALAQFRRANDLDHDVFSSRRVMSASMPSSSRVRPKVKSASSTQSDAAPNAPDSSAAASPG